MHGQHILLCSTTVGKCETSVIGPMNLNVSNEDVDARHEKHRGGTNFLPLIQSLKGAIDLKKSIWPETFRRQWSAR